MGGGRDEEAGDVAQVDRLEQQLDAGIGEPRRGILQVGDERRLQRLPVDAVRRDAGEQLSLGQSSARA